MPCFYSAAHKFFYHYYLDFFYYLWIQSFSLWEEELGCVWEGQFSLGEKGDKKTMKTDMRLSTTRDKKSLLFLCLSLPP